MVPPLTRPKLYAVNSVKLPFFLLALATFAPAATVTTLIGDGTPGFSDTQVNNPYGLVIGPDGALYFCDLGNQRIRRLDLKTKRLTTIAGDGQKGYRGDGGPALQASLNMPHELRFGPDGDIYIAERDNHVIRKVDTKTGVISTFAGTGKSRLFRRRRPGNIRSAQPTTQYLLRSRRITAHLRHHK